MFNLTSARKYDCVIEITPNNVSYSEMRIGLSSEVSDTLKKEIENLEKTNGFQMYKTANDSILFHINLCWDVKEVANTLKESLEKEGLKVAVKSSKKPV